MEWLGRNRKSVIIAVVLVIAFAAGYFFYKSRNAEQGRLILYGNVDIRQISLAFNSNGRIEEMLKEEGDAVKAGDVLARLDTRPLELAIAQKKAAIAQQEAVVAKLHNGSRPEEITQAAAQVESLAAAENNARAYYRRMASLFADGAVSKVPMMRKHDGKRRRPIWKMRRLHCLWQTKGPVMKISRRQKRSFPL